jgi:hypothetical protein
MARTWQLQFEDLKPEESAPYRRMVSLPKTPTPREGPGVGVLVWHSATFPVSRDCTYGFACMEPDFEFVPEWVPFPGCDQVRVAGP